MAPSKALVGFFTVLSACAAFGCSGSTEKPPEAAQGANKPLVGADDQSRCDYKGRNDREVIESSGPGAKLPNVRRVFGILGEGEDRRKVLFCREIDTNLDGSKDVVRTYNDKGDAIGEQADANYDGRVDTWLKFAAGRISKVELDRNYDGKVDETRFYVKGKVSRIQRDRNYDNKPDIWEVYAEGVLERMGVDLDFDGHVDRWDRDEVARRVAEDKEREEDEKAAAEKKKAEEAEKAANDAARSARSGSKAAMPATPATPPK